MRLKVVDLHEPERAEEAATTLEPACVSFLYTRRDAWHAHAGPSEARFAVLPAAPHEGIAGAARWDRVLLFLPHGKARLHELAAASAGVVAEDGELLLVGANTAGIRSAGLVLADYWTTVDRLESARHCQLWRAAGPREVEAPSLEQRHAVSVSDVRLTVVTRPGVFSADGLDDGTRLLLENLRVPEAGRAVDVGCGAGVIGAYLAMKQPALDVVCADVSAVALAATEATLAANGVAARVVASDLLDEVEGSIDLIVSNPPFHQGVQTDYGVGERLVRQAAARLHRRGRLVLVCNRFLRYGQWLEEHFQQVTRLADDGRYQVWQAAGPVLRRRPRL